MLSILIVDDEPIIVDGIFELVQSAFDGRLIVCRAYSAAQACRVINEAPFDILLTDIDMPGMTGLALHAWTLERWPLCTALYLTGYSDFDYVRQALDQRAVAYVLKSDGDETIVAAVERAILEVERKQTQVMTDAELTLARPIYEKEWVNRLIREEVTQQERTRWLRSLNNPLHPDEPVMFAICVLERHGPDMDSLALALDTAPSPGVRFLHAPVSDCAMAVFSQTSPRADARLFSGTLETQRRMLGAEDTLTLVIARHPIAWEDVPQAYASMLAALSSIRPGSGEVLTLDTIQTGIVAMASPFVTPWKEAFFSLAMCAEYLAMSRRELFDREIGRLWSLLRLEPDTGRVQEALRSLKDLLESNIRQFIPAMATDPTPAFSGGNMGEARVAVDAISSALFDAWDDTMRTQRQSIVETVNRYIAEHLSEDISLSSIAEVVHYHPAYLSRIYKENASLGLSEYISGLRMEEACRLLVDTRMRVSDIARQLGFSTATYFARFFRKHQGMSPQAFRDQATSQTY